MRNLWMIAALALGGCTGTVDTTDTTGGDADADADADTDADTDEDTDTDVPVVCADLSVGNAENPEASICDNAPACRSLKGFPVIEDPDVDGGYCVDNSSLPKRIGCTEKERNCEGGPVTWGRPPQAADDVCFKVLGRCLPRDYVPCVGVREVENICGE